MRRRATSEGRAYGDIDETWKSERKSHFWFPTRSLVATCGWLPTILVSYGFTVGLGFSFTFPRHWPLPVVCLLDLLPLFPSLHVPSHCKLMDQSSVLYHVWCLGQLSPSPLQPVFRVYIPPFSAFSSQVPHPGSVT